jgi:two-component sensor histidine kinase
MSFFKIILLSTYTLLFLSNPFVLASNKPIPLSNHIQVPTEKNVFFEQEKNKTISKQTINEIKKSQILILIVVVFFVSGFLFLIYHVKKTKIINNQLESYAKENEFLISETNHRVNNNLQLISILISETLRKKQNDTNKIEFEKLLSKVETIASLHRHLYVTKNKDKVELKDYLLEVKTNFNTFVIEKDISINFTLDNVKINPDDAMYLGLMITELIINSVKYAFHSSQKKLINLQVEWNKTEQEIAFNYQDNGELSKGKEIQPVLVLQLGQQLAVNPILNSDNGFCLTFTKKMKSNA